MQKKVPHIFSRYQFRYNIIRLIVKILYSLMYTLPEIHSRRQCSLLNMATRILYETLTVQFVVTHERFPISSADYRTRWVQSAPKSCRTSQTNRKRSSECLRVD